MPIAALVVEGSMHLCASFYTDPIPSLFCSICVALVPVSTFLSMRVLGMKAVSKADLMIAGAFNGFALAVSVVYAAVFLPIVPISFIAILFLGLGFLGFSPMASAWATFLARKRVSALLKEHNLKMIPLDLCISLLLIVCGLNSFSSNLTTLCQSQVASNSENLPTSVLLMRAFGDTETYLRSCYGLVTLNMPFVMSRILTRGLNSSDLFYSQNQIPESLARELCYRVSGKSFNTFPRPKLIPSDHYSFLDDNYDYFYDKDFTGEDVGGVVRDLKLEDSRISGVVDPEAMAEHLVWEMKFAKKASYFTPELRAQIMLPPGAVVSGAWLMVDGVKREAVFHERKNARAEYVDRARNYQSTLLIATAGPGRVLLQSPAVSGDLDLCVQIDSPMKVLSDGKVSTALPFISERNFGMTGKSAVNLSVLEKNSSNVSVIKAVNAKDKPASFSNAELFEGKGSARFSRNAGKTIFVSEDAADPSKQVIQSLEKTRVSKAKPLIVVLDGSDSMSDIAKSICDELQDVKFNDATLIWASDKPVVLSKHIDTGSFEWKHDIGRIRDSACVGGQDNAAAILLALQNIGDAGANVVWIHGPQSIKFGQVDLQQIWPIENPNGVELFDYQATLGPNELCRSLDSARWIKPVGHGDGVKGDLQRLFSELAGQSDIYRLNRRFEERSTRSVDAPPFISQLCANDQVNSDQLAEKYHIVTPKCSAVILLDQAAPQNPLLSRRDINQAQQKSQSTSATVAESAKGVSKEKAADSKDKSAATAASAEPVDVANSANLIPTKPEPPLGILMFVALLILLFARMRSAVFKVKC